jgi:hypothetical protein
MTRTTKSLKILYEFLFVVDTSFIDCLADIGVRSFCQSSMKYFTVHDQMLRAYCKVTDMAKFENDDMR